MSTFPIFGLSITTIPSLENVVVCDPIAGRAGSWFKIADNEGPRPQDRVFFTYNYFDNLAGAGGASTAFAFSPDQVTTVSVPGIATPVRADNLHRALFG